MSEEHLLRLTLNTLMEWSLEEAMLNDEGLEGMQARFIEITNGYLETLVDTLTGEHK